MLGTFFLTQTALTYAAMGFGNDVTKRQITQLWIKEVSASQQVFLYATMIVTVVSTFVIPLGLLIGLIVIIVTWKNKEKRKLGVKILLWSIFIPILLLLIIWIISSLTMFLGW